MRKAGISTPYVVGSTVAYSAASVTYPAYQSGDLLLAMVSSLLTAPTAGAGWTKVSTSPWRLNTAYGQMWTCTDPPNSANNFTPNNVSSGTTFTILAIRGASLVTNSTVNAVGTNTSGTSSPATMPISAITTTVANCLGIAWWAQSATGTIITVNNNMDAYPAYSDPLASYLGVAPLPTATTYAAGTFSATTNKTGTYYGNDIVAIAPA